MRGSATIAAYRWTYGVRYLSDQIDRATWRNTLVYRATPDLQLGVEYNPLAGDVNPLLNWRALRETRSLPAVTFGTSSDRIGTPDGLAYYVTFSKALPGPPGRAIAPYVALLWSEHDERLRVPFGASIPLGGGRSLTPLYDGHAFHMLASVTRGRYTFTGLLVRGKDPGLAVTLGF